MLNLAELVGMYTTHKLFVNSKRLLAVRPDLVRLRKVLYFHENQMNYPVRHEQERDIQFAWNQIVSSCVLAMRLQLISYRAWPRMWFFSTHNTI